MSDSATLTVLDNLVSHGVLRSFKLQTLDADDNVITGPLGETNRERDQLTLTFPLGDMITLDTFCSGSAENVSMYIENASIPEIVSDEDKLQNEIHTRVWKASKVEQAKHYVEDVTVLSSVINRLQNELRETKWKLEEVTDGEHKRAHECIHEVNTILKKHGFASYEGPLG